MSWTPMSPKPFHRRGTACRPLVPPSPCGTPGRASPTPTSPDCIHPFERRLRLCDPEAATVNSSWELTVGSSSKKKPKVKRAVTGYPIPPPEIVLQSQKVFEL